MGLRLRWLCEIARAGFLACSCTNSGGFPARSHVVVILNPQQARGRAGIAGRARERRGDFPEQWLDRWCLTVLRPLVVTQMPQMF